MRTIRIYTDALSIYLYHDFGIHIPLHKDRLMTGIPQTSSLARGASTLFESAPMMRYIGPLLRTYLSMMLWLIFVIFPILLTAQSFPLNTLDGLVLQNVLAEPATYEGQTALKVTEDSDAQGDIRLVIVENSVIQDGIIEVELAGRPATGAMEGARGFVGIAFRVAPDASQYECFYLRPTNGRADDQLRRNHTTQYVSHPDYEWYRLREETPGAYESYVDLEPGVWTKVKIDISGQKARLYVHGAGQPSLIVNDLKLGESRGAVALWIGPGTEAYFANLSLSK